MNQYLPNCLGSCGISADAFGIDVIDPAREYPTTSGFIDDRPSDELPNSVDESLKIPALCSDGSNDFPNSFCSKPQYPFGDGRDQGDKFDAARLFSAVFNPAPGEVLTMMQDLPHGEIADKPAWARRRAMIQEWWEMIKSQAARWNIQVNPIASYLATGYNNGELPDACFIEGKVRSLGEVIMESSMIMAMTQFSASAPLMGWTEKNDRLRVASMPGVLKSMESTALSADYAELKRKSIEVGRIFDRAISAEVIFSTGHRCNFRLGNITCYDNGILHPSNGRGSRLCNLPAGEVCMVPSNAEGKLPHVIEGGLVVYSVRNKQIVDIEGDEPVAMERRAYFDLDPSRRNIAEFAVGINDWASGTSPATVEAEKAHGIHWAYGRDKHIPGGKVGAEHFLSPEFVVHQDIVYARDRSIICSKLIMKLKDGTHYVLIENGKLLI